VIGDDIGAAGNIILASGWSGVVIQNGTGNTIEGNAIGTNGGRVNWGNTYYGIVVEYTEGSTGEDNLINFNEIAYNGTHNGLDTAESGVYVNRSDGNMISRNSIHDNDGPGIKLVNSGNNNMPAPVITSGSCEGVISGTSAANAWVQIFSDNADEGRTWEGTTQANGSGIWSWPGGVAGPYLTATARDGSTLDTSPFSSPYAVGICKVYFYIPLFTKN
jgi:parallel beta-helix repeat protein